MAEKIRALTSRVGQFARMSTNQGTPLLRTHFYSGQVLTSTDFQAEQDYLCARARLHNRVAHGFGVAYGLAVSQDANGQIEISKGAVVSALGDELEFAAPVTLSAPALGHTFSVTARLAETLISPVPTSSGIEFSRIESVPVIEALPDFVPAPGNLDYLELARFHRAGTSWHRDP